MISYQSLLLSTIILNDNHTVQMLLLENFDEVLAKITSVNIFSLHCQFFLQLCVIICKFTIILNEKRIML